MIIYIIVQYIHTYIIVQYKKLVARQCLPNIHAQIGKSSTDSHYLVHISYSLNLDH